MAAAEAREPPPALPFSAVKETVTEMGQQEVEKLLGKAVYRATQVPRWTATISERLMKRLVALRAQKKYIIVVNILEKKQQSIGKPGYHCASTAYWDSSQDGVAKVKWENDTMHVVVMVFGIAL